MMGIASTVTLLVGGIFLGTALFVQFLPSDQRLRQSLRLFVALCPFICGFFVCRAIGYGVNDLEMAGRLLAWQHCFAGVFFAIFPFLLSSLIGFRVGPLVIGLSALGAVISLWAPFTVAGLTMTHVAELEPWLTPWGERIPVPHGPARATAFPVLGVGVAESLLGLYWMSRGLKQLPLAVRMCVAACLAMFSVSLFYHAAILLKIVHGPLVGEWSVGFLLLAVGGLISHRSRMQANEHRELLNAISEAVFVHDAESGQIIEANARAAATFQCSREQILGRFLPEFMDAAQRFDAARLAEYMQQAQSGVAESISVRCLRRNGQVFDAELSPSAAIIGGRTCVITSVRDVSRRIAAEGESRTQALRLDDFINRAPMAVCEIAESGYIERLNQQFLHLFCIDETGLTSWDDLLAIWHADLAMRNQLRETFHNEMMAAADKQGVLGPLPMRVSGRDGIKALSCSGVVSSDRRLLFFVDLTTLERTRTELLQQAALSDAVIANAAEGVAVCEWMPGGQPVFAVWNPCLAEMTGYTQEVINTVGWFESAYATDEERAQARALMERLTTDASQGKVEWVIRRADATECILSVSASVLPSRGEGIRVIVLVMRDVTERRRAERERRQLEVQVQHAQKLESLGVLAGGIAHDFNNILMSVLGRASLLGNQLPLTHEAHPHLREIENAANRAAELCRQMLAYAGKGRFIVEPLDLETAVTEMGRMLEVSIAKKIVLKYDFADGLPAVNADASQIRQVIMNLITNASEAIGDRSGVITLRTGVMDCDREYLRETYLDDDLPVGLYAYIEVADTGCGMDVETRQRLFEPFYTTKFTGRGLGMAAVLGIIRGHRGAIKVYSEPRRGTTFKVLFPAISQRAVPASGTMHESLRLPSGLRILVVDDEETIRALAKDMLIGLGADVLLAADGREALAVFSRFSQEIDIVLLDLTMPHMDGDETFRELRRVNRDVRVIMSSGYNQQEVTQRFAGKGLVGFLQKPYNLQALVSAIRQALPNDGGGTDDSGNSKSAY